MPKVLNKTRDVVPLGEAVYIGRPSPWGNPFLIGRDGTREEVIRKFSEYLFANPDLVARVQAELRGKDLVCFCAPEACHGDVLIYLANLKDS